MTRFTGYPSPLHRAVSCRVATRYQPGRTSRRSRSRGARRNRLPAFAVSTRYLRRRFPPSLHVQAPDPLRPLLPASLSSDQAPHRARAPALARTRPLPTRPRHRHRSPAAPPPWPPHLPACVSRRLTALSSSRRAATTSRRAASRGRLRLRSASACPSALRPPRPSAARPVPLTGS
jgi:hypothetical protein